MFDHVLSILIRNAIDGVVLTALVLVVMLLFRERIAAKWRFILLGLVIVRLAMPVQPPGYFCLSTWSDAFQPNDVAAPVEQEVVGIPAPTPTAPIERLSHVPLDLHHPANDVTTGNVGEFPRDAAPSAVTETSTATASTELIEQSPSVDTPVLQSTIPFPWTECILALWLMGVLILAIRRVVTGIRLRQLLARAVPCDSRELRDEFEVCHRLLKLNDNVELSLSDDIPGPSVTGVVQPRVLCPRHVAEALSASDLRLLLMHELVHIQRWDVLWKELVDLVCIVNWFHPAAWWIKRLMEQEREFACDARVLELSTNTQREQYGRMAIRLLELQQDRSHSLGLVAWTGTKQHLKRRIEMIARFESPRRWQSFLAVMLTAALAAIGLTRAADEPVDSASSTDVQIPVASNDDTASVENAVPVAGRCVDDEGTPLADVSLRLLRIQYSDNSAEELANVMSNDDGSFRFPQFVPFDHDAGATGYDVVIAQLEGQATAQKYLDARRDDVASWQQLELVLQEPASLKGRVVDDADQPVAGADVYLQSWPREPLPGLLHSRTNEDGEYDIVDATPWEPTSGLNEDGETGWAVNQFFFYVSHPDYGVRRVVANARPGVVDIVLEPASIVVGQVTYEDGSPAADVEVNTQGTKHGNWSEVLTDAEGRYRLVLADVDDYNIWANADDLICEAIDSFEVAPGESREAPTLTLVEGAFVTGHVLDADTGKPLDVYPENTRVASYGPHRPRSGAACISAPVNEDGSFRLRVAPGDVYVYLMNIEDLEFVDPRATTISVGDGEEVAVTFLIREYTDGEPVSATDTPVRPELPQAGREMLRQRGLSRAERPAIAAITELGGWVTTEIIDGNEFVVELNMVYHEPEDGERLDNTQVTDEALFYASKFTHLRMLALKEGQASDQGLAYVAGLEELEKIYMWDAFMVTDEGVAHLAELPNLEYIHLSKSAVTDESLRLLSQMSTLKGISMQENAFTDQGLEYLSEMTQIKTLWIGLGETQITDEGLSQLANLENLEELDLQNTQVTDAGLEHLYGLSHLKEIHLSGTEVTDAGIAALKAAIPEIEANR